MSRSPVALDPFTGPIRDRKGRLVVPAGKTMRSRDREEVSGVILAGGRGTRLGTDKRHIHLLGVSLLHRAVALCAPITGDLVVVAREEGASLDRGRVVGDEVADRGPIAGLLTGLRHARHATALVIPIDMPFLTAGFLQCLVEVSGGSDITVPRWSRGIEPLVGVYTRSCLDILTELVRGGTTAVHAFIQSTPLAVRYVEAAEIQAFGPPERLFFNVNTWADVAAAEAMLRESVRPSRSEPR